MRGAFPERDMPWRVRDAEKTRMFPAEKTEVMIRALMMSGRILTLKWFIAMTYGELSYGVSHLLCAV